MSNYLLQLKVEVEEMPDGSFAAFCQQPPVLAAAPTLELVLDRVRASARRLLALEPDIESYLSSQEISFEILLQAGPQVTTVPLVLGG